ncbi:MAG: GH92 family glycosyl hydrolase [Bacteroidales bacterium]|nr:GH92 family glycosyl hydrolase [Bacteroidales bacterium]
MNRFLLPVTILVVLINLSCTQREQADEFEPVELVSTLTGSLSDFSLSNGNTYPAIALPWGMNFWTPQTGKMGDGWIYTYTAKKIRGFRQTHQPSPWINDYGQFSVLPVTGTPQIDEEKRASWFSHKTEIARPYYYSAYLADYDVTAEITPTERAAVFRFTFPETDSAFVIIDAFDRGSSVTILPEENKIIGYSSRNSGGVPDGFKNYFIMVFDRPFLSYAVWHDSVVISNKASCTGNHTGALVQFQTHKGEQVVMKTASSFISAEQATLNLKEVGSSSFDDIKTTAKSIWNRELGRIKIVGGSEASQRTFYSCLYRVMLFPRKFFEIDAEGRIVHYSPYSGRVLPGYMFTDNGFWDTFRAVFPFFNLMYPSLVSQVQEGLVNAYAESGWLPEWASPGHRDCMIGSNSASVVAEAYLKGAGGYDIDTLYKALLKNSENEGPLGSVGRKGAKCYNEKGYIPYDVGINESVARSLEYAYNDFAIWMLAKQLKRPQMEIDRFAKQCQNYRNVFDTLTSLMRGRNSDGSFQEPFNPFKWGDAFTEGNSWHYTWSVLHDVQGLIGLMGGKERFIGMLDSVFSLPPVYDDSYYGFTIHEIREMQIINMGNYAHGNQPVQHMIYLYNFAGEPWKTQFWVREAMDRLYSPMPDGYCGDEDNGQTSAWYVFSALGFYPVCPVTGEYILGSPLFEKATVQLENGNKIIIEAENNSSRNRYIRSVKFNGRPYTKNWLKHSELMKGATIRFKMDSVPNQSRGIAKDDLPYSFSSF